MYPGIDGIRVPLQWTYEELVTERTGKPGKQRYIQRFNAVDVEGVDVFSIVGIRHGATQCRALPFILFAEGDHMIENLSGDVRFHDAYPGGRGNGAHRHRRLLLVRHWDT